MKKKRSIIVKDEKLRKCRENLRVLFLKAIQDQWFKLNEERNSILKDINGNFREISLEQKKLAKDYKNKMDHIQDILNHTICKCPVCGDYKKDMIYIPLAHRWFCIDCYNLNHDYYKNTKYSYLFY